MILSLRRNRRTTQAATSPPERVEHVDFDITHAVILWVRLANLHFVDRLLCPCKQGMRIDPAGNLRRRTRRLHHDRRTLLSGRLVTAKNRSQCRDDRRRSRSNRSPAPPDNRIHTHRPPCRNVRRQECGQREQRRQRPKRQRVRGSNPEAGSILSDPRRRTPSPRPRVLRKVKFNVTVYVNRIAS